MPKRKNGKLVITALLAISCVISGVILAGSPAYRNNSLENTQQLDSLINVHIHNSMINQPQVRTANIQVDTVFTRKTYRLRVPSRFSKTMFHINLHKDLNRFGIESPARINFPSRDMHIYVYNEGTVLRTMRLTTDPSLDTLQVEPIESD